MVSLWVPLLLVLQRLQLQVLDVSGPMWTLQVLGVMLTLYGINYGPFPMQNLP